MKMYSLIYEIVEKADVHELKRLASDLNENVLRGVSAHFHHSETYRNRTQEAILYLVNKSQELPRGIYVLNKGSLDNETRYKDLERMEVIVTEVLVALQSAIKHCQANEVDASPMFKIPSSFVDLINSNLKGEAKEKFLNAIRECEIIQFNRGIIT